MTTRKIFDVGNLPIITAKSVYDAAIEFNKNYNDGECRQGYFPFTIDKQQYYAKECNKIINDYLLKNYDNINYDFLLDGEIVLLHYI